MNAHELRDRLIAEGRYAFVIVLRNEKRSLRSPDERASMLEGSGVDLLENDGDTWRVYFQERGSFQPSKFESQSEEEACEYYFQLIMQQFAS